MQEFENLLITRDEGILCITVNRPSKLNALNRHTLRELNICLTAGQEDTSVRAVLITGSGEKAFVAGADIAEFSGLSAEEGEKMARNGHFSVFNILENYPKPVLAAINGYALGGGLELALACHLRIASENAKMGLPELSLGLIPGYGGTQRLTRLVGRAKALEYILLGTQMTAAEALTVGLVNQVVPAEELIVYSKALLHKLIKRSALALAAAIRAVNAAEGIYAAAQAHALPDTRFETTTERGFETEITEFSALFSSADFREGVAAFLEKREARFRGV